MLASLKAKGDIMMKVFLIILGAALFAPSAQAFKEGKFTCQFEVVSKKNFPKVEKLPPFTFNAMEAFSEAYQAKSLENRLIIAYYPGFAKPGDLSLHVMDMKYNGANAGADVPAVADGNFTFKISRDDSDLVGAFLNCRSELR